MLPHFYPGPCNFVVLHGCFADAGGEVVANLVIVDLMVVHEVVGWTVVANMLCCELEVVEVAWWAQTHISSW